MPTSASKRLTYALILAALAVVLFLVIQFVNIGEKKEEEPIGEAIPASEMLFEKSQEKTLANIQVVDNDSGAAFNVTKQEDGTWLIVEAPEESDIGLQANGQLVTNAGFSLQFLSSSRTLDEIQSFALYGLDEPRYTVKFGTEDGAVYTLYVGSANPGESSYYVKLPTSNLIYLVPKFSLDQVIDFLENPPYFQPTPDPNVTPAEEGAEEEIEEDVEDEEAEEATEEPTPESTEESTNGD